MAGAFIGLASGPEVGPSGEAEGRERRSGRRTAEEGGGGKVTVTGPAEPLSRKKGSKLPSA